MIKIMYPKINFWGKAQMNRGINIESDTLKFINCIGEKEKESLEVEISEIKYLKHLARYKLFVLEGAAINDPRSLIVLADQNEHALVKINIFSFKKSDLISLIEQLLIKNPEIECDQAIDEIRHKKSFRIVSWSFFTAILRGLKIYFFLLVVYGVVSFFRNLKMIITITIFIVLTVLILKILFP